MADGDGDRSSSMTAAGDSGIGEGRGGHALRGHLPLADHVPVSRCIIQACRMGETNLGALLDAEFDLRRIG